MSSSYAGSSTGSQKLTKKISQQMLAFVDYPRVPLEYIMSVSPQSKDVAAKGLEVTVSNLTRTLSRAGHKMLESIKACAVSLPTSSQISRQAHITFCGGSAIPDFLPTHVLVLNKPNEKHTIYCFPTHSSILLANCAVVTPQITLNMMSSLQTRRDRATGEVKYELVVPTYVMELPEPVYFTPLHDWMYTRNTIHLVLALFSDDPRALIPAPSSGCIKLLGSAAQPELRDQAIATLYSWMCERFTVQALVIVLNRLRGVKVNANSLHVNSKDLHITLDALWETAYKACQVLAGQSSVKSNHAPSSYSYSRSSGYRNSGRR